MANRKPRIDTKEQERVPAETAEKGRFAALEDDDNSIEVSNEAYVGVDPMYQNAAYPTTSAKTGEDDDEEALAEMVNANDADHALTVDQTHRAGYSKGVAHPSDRADIEREANAAAQAQVEVANEQALAAARAELAPQDDDDTDDDTGDSTTTEPPVAPPA